MNFYHAYLIGYNLSYIAMAANNSWPPKIQGGGDICECIKNISFLLETKTFVTSIHQSMNTWLETLKKYENGSALTENDASLLNNAIIVWDDRIKTALAATPAICLYKEGLLNFERLQKGARSFINKGIWERFSSSTQDDLDDAAKCLLCKLPTPAVMISLRAVEDALRQYYKFKTGMNHGKKGWKNILDELLTRNNDNYKYDVDDKLIGLLDFIRDKERNLAEHPDKRFTQEEAEGIFHEVTKTITEIYKHIPPPTLNANKATKNKKVDI